MSTPLQPPSGTFGSDGPTSRQNNVLSQTQALKTQPQHLSRETSLPGGGTNTAIDAGLASKPSSVADGPSRPQFPSANHPQTTPTGSNIKRAFTAKRTNRPERPLPSTLTTNKYLKNSPKASRDGNSRSAASPEPAKVVSDIVKKSTESSSSASTGFIPASGPASSHESGMAPFDRHLLQNPFEKGLKRKHEEGQFNHTSTPRFRVYKKLEEESTPGSLQSPRGQTQDGGATSSTCEARPVEHPAKKAKHNEEESRGTAHTPLPGAIKPVKPIRIHLKPSTVLSASPRTSINPDSNSGPQTNLHKNKNNTQAPDEEDDDNDDDDDAPQIIREQRRQDSDSHDKGNESDTADVVIKEYSPKVETDKSRSISSSSEQVGPGGKATATTKLAENADEWKYNVFTLSSGQTLMTGGVLIPRNYQHYHDPIFSWVCPIRTCRTLFKKLVGLGAHFSKVHRGCDLNDNLDGTLSIVGRKGTLSPKVVSKKPLDPDNEPPMPEPQPPPLIARKLSQAASAAEARSEVIPKVTRARDTSASRPSRELQEETPKASAVPSPDAEFTPDPDQAELWEYIHARLKETPKSPIPQFGYVPELLRMPRLREVEFNPDAPFPYHEKKLQDISSMILQVTGVKPPRACLRCRGGKGVFKGCYVIPPDAPLHLRQSIRCCGNCFYKLRYGECDLREWHLKRYPELSENHHPPAPAPSSSPPGRRSERIVIKESRAVTTPSRYELRQRQLDAGEDIAHPSSAKKKERDRHDHGSSKRHELARSGDTVSNITGNALDPVTMLELETWEVAPGRIRNEGSQIIDNIAFSNSYLSRNQAVRVSRDVSFQVITIKPGTAHNFGAVPGKLRLCSVASGKTKVKMAEQEFDMGPHGMFKVSPGVAATAMNMLYIDVMMHVSVMPGDL